MYYLVLLEFDKFLLCIVFSAEQILSQAGLTDSGLSQFHNVSVFISTCIFQFILSVI